jgi:hypothetical protein
MNSFILYLATDQLMIFISKFKCKETKEYDNHNFEL